MLDLGAACNGQTRTDRAVESVYEAFRCQHALSHPACLLDIDAIDTTLQMSSKIEGEITFLVAFDKSAPKQFERVASTAGAIQLTAAASKYQIPPSRHSQNLTYTLSPSPTKFRFLRLRGSGGLRVSGVDRDTARVTINGQLVKLVEWNCHTTWCKLQTPPVQRNAEKTGTPITSSVTLDQRPKGT